MTVLLVAEGVITAAGTIGDSVLIDDGRVVAVGLRSQLLRPGMDEVRHAGGFITAGLADAHIHLAGWSALTVGLDLGLATDFAMVGEMVLAQAARLGPGSPIIGTRLDDTLLIENRLPDRNELDRIESDRPLLLYRHCGHIAVANGAALALAGVDKRSADPAGGSMDRDHTGEPTGVLRESAIGRVARALEPLVASPSAVDLVSTAHRLLALGITRVEAMVAGGQSLWCGTGNELDELVAAADRLPIDISVYVIADHPIELRTAAERIRRAGGRLRFGGWKGFADGSLGGRTAALRAPYSDDGGIGMVLLDEEHHRALIETSLAEEGGVALHAIGDRAVDLALDLFEHCVAAGANPARLRIEHASMLDDAAIERFAQLGIAASVQPSFVSSDAGWVATRVGDRLPTVHPFATMLEAGIQLVGGSDAPVEDPNPWRAMDSARNHATSPGQSVTAAQALAMYSAATIEPNKAADLIVVDRDPLTTEHIGETRVLEVWKDGLPAR